MEVYYVQPGEIIGEMLRITGDEHHHLARVLRRRAGDEVYATSGEGIMYRTTIADIGGDVAVCRIEERMTQFNELSAPIILIQGVLKNPGKMDFIVEKTTELGVARIVPVRTRFTVAKGGKVDRWRSIALSAMKQCGRSRLPEIADVISLEEALTEPEGLLILCDEEEYTGAAIEAALAVHNGGQPVTIAVGPEGGFSGEERAMFAEAGAHSVSLGARRLRGETAAVAAMARTAAALEQSIIKPQ